MRGLQIKGVKEFELKEMEMPMAENGEVIIKIEKCGICGSDIHYWENGDVKGLVLGHEYVGTVVDTGSRKDLNIGDRVTALPISPCGKCSSCESGNPQFCTETWLHATGLSLDYPGGLSEVIKVRSDMVIKIPDEVKDEEAAMVEPLAVSLHAIHLADIKVGQKVLVVGGGIIGLTSAELAKKEGASFVAVSETNSKRGEKAVKLGVCDTWYDAKNESILNEMMKKTKDGFDVVIDACGNSSAVTSSLMAVKPGGKIILVGVATKPITIPTVMAVMKEVQVQGAIAYTRKEFETCIHLIQEKQIEVMKFVDKIVGLEEVQSAYEELTSGTSDTIKILVEPQK